MTPLQENKLMNAVLKAVVAGKGRKAIAIAAKKDKKLGKQIAKQGRKKYLRYFNSEIVSDFILSKTFGYKSKNRFIWYKN